MSHAPQLHLYHVIGLGRLMADLSRDLLGTRRTDRRILGALAGRAPGRTAPASLIAIVRAVKTLPDAPSREAFRRLLLHVHARAGGVLDAVDAGAGTPYVSGLQSLAREHARWRRPLEAWRPTSGDAALAFAQLARHLLAPGPAPPELDAALLAGEPPVAVRRLVEGRTLPLRRELPGLRFRLLAGGARARRAAGMREGARPATRIGCGPRRAGART